MNEAGVGGGGGAVIWGGGYLIQLAEFPLQRGRTCDARGR